MIKISDIYAVLGVCVLALQITDANSREWLVESSIDTRAEYNDNIFLTSEPHDSVTGLIITPSLAGVIREKNWEAKLKAKIKSNHYSDQNLNSNDQFFTLAGNYNENRNIFSLGANYTLDSNLNAESTDFGITGKRVNRKIQSISPQYTRLLTERLMLTFLYTYSDVSYLEAENTAYIPYITNTGQASLVYNLTEKNHFTYSLQAVDYASKDNMVTYQLFVSRIGVDHRFSELLSTDFLFGISRRNSTNLNTQTFDFFGNIITSSQEVDTKNRGLVYDAGITQLLETGSIRGRVSRNDTTNSFGGLNQVDQVTVAYEKKLSSLWRYTLDGRYEIVTAIGASNQNSDRDVFGFTTKAYYTITRDWVFNASYRYIIRKFKSDTSDNKAPDSNSLYVGLTYNFPSLSTF